MVSTVYENELFIFSIVPIQRETRPPPGQNAYVINVVCEGENLYTDNPLMQTTLVNIGWEHLDSEVQPDPLYDDFHYLLIKSGTSREKRAAFLAAYVTHVGFRLKK